MDERLAHRSLGTRACTRALARSVRNGDLSAAASAFTGPSLMKTSASRVSLKASPPAKAKNPFSAGSINVNSKPPADFALSSFRILLSNDSLHYPHRPRRLHGPLQRRYGSNHPEAVPQTHRAHWLRPIPLLRLALPGRRQNPGLRL